MTSCSLCSQYKLKFDRVYAPEDYLEGKNNSLIWIIGLNPKLEKGFEVAKTLDALESTFDKGKKIHSYFKDFEKVSPKLYKLFGKDRGVAHTDIVRCPSQNFPVRMKDIINNCKPYLNKQLLEKTPKLIICNGIKVCDIIKDFITPPTNFEALETSYSTTYGGKEVAIILSGFIGRIDNYAKRRLGMEIEKYMTKLGIG